MSGEPPAARHEIFVEWTVVVKKVRDKRRFLDWRPMRPSYGKYNEKKPACLHDFFIYFSFSGAEFNLQNKPHLLFYLFPVALKEHLP